MSGRHGCRERRIGDDLWSAWHVPAPRDRQKEKKMNEQEHEHEQNPDPVAREDETIRRLRAELRAARRRRRQARHEATLEDFRALPFGGLNVGGW
jgi:hypothetical protein